MVKNGKLSFYYVKSVKRKGGKVACIFYQIPRKFYSSFEKLPVVKKRNDHLLYSLYWYPVSKNKKRKNKISELGFKFQLKNLSSTCDWTNLLKLQTLGLHRYLHLSHGTIERIKWSNACKSLISSAWIIMVEWYF